MMFISRRLHKLWLVAVSMGIILVPYLLAQRLNTYYEGVPPTQRAHDAMITSS